MSDPASTLPAAPSAAASAAASTPAAPGPVAPGAAVDERGEPRVLGSFNGHDIYPMPIYVTLEEPDLDAAIVWYQEALGCAPMFVARGPDGRAQLAHLRRARYQDLLLVPSPAPAPAVGERVAIGLRADGDPVELAARARAAAPVGAAAVEGPIDTPWNTTEVRVTDPGGHRIVLSAQRTAPDPEAEARVRAWLERGRTS